jgi:protein-disulfide isomerase
MHDGLYANQDELGLTLILGLGRTLGLSDLGLRDALAQRRFAPKIQADFLGGVRSGVNGTPSFFINGAKHQGSYAYEELAAAIDARLHASAVP